MKFFDLHCDTLYEMYNRGSCLYQNDCHVCLKDIGELEYYIGCFAIWMPDDYRGNYAVEFFNKIYEKFEREKVKNASNLTLIKSSENINEVCTEKPGIILTIEGGSVLNSDLKMVKRLYDMGVRVITLTWNGGNEIGDGNEVESPKGITEFGIKAVAEMEKSGIIVDVSHASKPLFYNVSEISKKPFIATHCNADSICKHSRNLTDDQFNIIREKGGLVGITFCKKFLNSEKEASICDIMKHIEHFLSMGGEKILAIGSDFDGTDVPKDLKGIQSVGILYEYLLKHNYSEELVDRIFYKNSVDFFKKML